MRYALPLLALLLAAGQAPAAESLGRLFYTPAQRAQLDALRSRKSIAQPVPEQQEPLPVPEVLTYGGIVRRSDGKTTVWINNRVVNDGKTAERLPISSHVRPDDSISLQLPQASRSIDLKVGQSVEIVSGVVAEPYARSPVSAPPQSKPGGTGGAAASKPDIPSTGAKGSSRDEEDDERGNR